MGGHPCANNADVLPSDPPSYLVLADHPHLTGDPWRGPPGAPPAPHPPRLRVLRLVRHPRGAYYY
eukprot:1186197-Prorocentrum_minimum.AAC.1